MRNKVRIWLLVVMGGLLLLGASLASGASDQDTPACDEVQQQDILDPTVAAYLDAGDQAAALQAAGEACLDCHADQEMVQALAVEEEVDESLSDGPG
ncbi:MAG: hypothetical protein K8S97_11520 [Anaerolineae bacterium]|nr:hypothetical protein [Anaerolineae bacterium]